MTENIIKPVEGKEVVLKPIDFDEALYGCGREDPRLWVRVKYQGTPYARVYAVPVEKHDQFGSMYQTETDDKLYSWLTENAIIMTDYLVIMRSHNTHGISTTLPMEDA